MILRRVIAHFKKQEWTAIALDFLIVVVGVFIGIQVSNWNAARADETAFQNAKQRLVDESVETLVFAEETRAEINTMLSDVQPAIDILRTCQTGAKAEAIVNKGLNMVRSGRGVGASTLAIDQLVSDERLLARQSESERLTLRRYHTDLHGINDTSEFIQNNAITSVTISDPLIGFTDLVDPAETFNKVDVRRAVLNAPLSEACKDHSFLTLFYSWERGHVFQLTLIDGLEEKVTEGMSALNLTSLTATPEPQE